jgi:hypothetical protein
MGLFLTLAHSSVSSTRPVFEFGTHFSDTVWLTLESRAEFFFCEFRNIHDSVPALFIEEPMETGVVLDSNFRDCSSDGIGAAMQMDASSSKIARVCATECKGSRSGLLVHYGGPITGELRRINESAVFECEELDESAPVASVTTNRDSVMVSEFNLTQCIGRAAAIGIFHDGVKAYKCVGGCIIAITNLEPSSRVQDSMFVRNVCNVGIIDTGSSLEVLGCYFSDNDIPIGRDVVFSQFLSEGEAEIRPTFFEVVIRIENCLFSSDELQTSVFELANNSWGAATIHMTGTFSCPALPIPTGSPVPTMTARTHNLRG